MVTITVDPNSETPPNFMSDEHRILRETVIEVHGADRMSDEQAAALLLKNWNVFWERRKTKWIEEREEREREAAMGQDERDNANTVFLRDFEGNLVSKFYQYGLIDWEQFHACLKIIICTSTPVWAIFEFAENASHGRGPLCSPGPANPKPGNYVILSPGGDPIPVTLVSQCARRRHLTTSNTGSKRHHYRDRVRQRDPFCLMSGRAVRQNLYDRFQSAHIFPRAHDMEWIKKGYSSLITDSASDQELGGPTKIDSLQNMMLLSTDLHHAWDNYRLARGHIIIPFVPGYEDVAGKVLLLNHITDPTIRPLDELFRDHFFQAVLRNMKGAGEPSWDYEDALGDGMMDLSRTDIWGSEEGCTTCT
ncbi:hypothetical protein C0992_003863 [Termitomyces sp. T32_za158]|nr:hypothetical protein C0992_003863 [Termitomyces sp. T32_za158]